ncbi:hypothetical protein TSUD_419220 [Trifolium subterraneum]|uniref:Uncharacterized protein n=1 Tax=Trifolium subterraneum TaxID=3900 RepID=A0A1B5Z8L0_TRISU|nr:hypothetical protein TSUD_419220 [Trifolium subterraneum]
MKKSKSFDSSKIRRSSRILSGAGKKPVVDTTVHVLDKSDSEIDRLEKEIDEFELEPVTSTKSEPVKTKKSPTPKKKEVKIAVKAPRTKKKIAVKKSKEKLLPALLIQPEDEEIFQKYWMTKSVAVSRLYNFAELSSGGVDLVKFVEPFEWKSFFHIKETVYPLLVQAFYYNAQVFPDKDIITSNIKDVELVVDPYVIGSLIGIKSEGLEVYGNDWVFRLYYADMDNTISENHYYTFSLKFFHHMKKDVETSAVDVGSKRKRDDFEKTNLNVLADASGDQLENDLQTGEQTQISGDVDPTTESDKLVTTAATTLQDLDIVIKGMVVQPSMINHLILESKTLRTWFTTVVCPQLHIPPPPEIETPQFDSFPATNDKSDDDCPTTSPAPDGANE